MKALKKFGIVLLDIIVAAFILTVLLYKISQIDAANRGKPVPGLYDISFIAINEQNILDGMNIGDMAVIAGSSLDNLKKGDVVLYIQDEGEAVLGRVESITGDTFIPESGSTDNLPGLPAAIDSIGGVYHFSVPYFGYVAAFTDTRAGAILCIALPSIIVLIIIASIVADIMHNTSRHRRKIIRRKQRRKQRYIKEGMCSNKGAMV